MQANRIVLVSGPSGAGKPTVARGLAEQSPLERAVHLHTDDIWRGFREVALPEDHVLDTSSQDAAESVGAVRRGLTDGRFRLESP